MARSPPQPASRTDTATARWRGACISLEQRGESIRLGIGTTSRSCRTFSAAANASSDIVASHLLRLALVGIPDDGC